MKIRRAVKMLQRIWTVIAICFLCRMSLIASAEGEIIGVSQTDAGDNNVTVSWNSIENAYGYNVYVSADNATYTRSTTDAECDVYGDTKKKIGNLTSGSIYYIKVEVVYKDGDGNLSAGSSSDVLEVVTAPAVTTVFSESIQQTDATSATISFAWSEVRGADNYIIYVNDIEKATVKETSATVEATAGSVNTVKIVPVKESSTGFKATGGHAEAYDFYAAPGQPIQVASFKKNNLIWQPTLSNKVTVGWNKAKGDEYDPSGYQMQIYSLTGKKLKTYTTTKTQKKFKLKAVKNAGFKVRVRAFVKIGEKTYYGDWSKTKTVIPQAKIQIGRSGKKMLTVRWSRVENATKYYVYACNNMKASGSKWKLEAVLDGNTRSYKYKKCKIGKSTAIYVIPEVTIGDETYKATYTWYLYMKISKNWG